jgi:long-chain acyl-CoA synthetase
MVKERLFAVLPQLELHSFYSQTEAGLVANLRPEEQQRFPNSLGQPVGGVEVRIVDDAMNDVPVGNPGEILVRCGEPGEVTVMREYFARPQANEEVFVDGWLRTGDLGRVGDGGFLYFVDRLKDMIISGGLNIYSREVEDTLLSHSAVSDAAVVGIPDPKFGEAVIAFVVVAGELFPSADALIDHCRAKIAGYKKPRNICILDEMPRNRTGKIAKDELRQRARAMFAVDSSDR